MLNNHVYKIQSFNSWQEFRERQLWTSEVNALIANNWLLLQKVYNTYIFEDKACRIEIERGKTLMNLEDALDLIKISEATMTKQEAINCYGMCKMPVTEEVPADYRDQHALHIEGGQIMCNKEYFELQQVEMAELICRIAESLQRRGQDEQSRSMHLIDDNYPYTKYVELVLDEIIWKKLKQKRKAGNDDGYDETEDDSEESENQDEEETNQ